MGGHLILTGHYHLSLPHWGGWTPMGGHLILTVQYHLSHWIFLGTIVIDWSISNVPWSISFVPQSLSNVLGQCRMSLSHYRLSSFLGDIWYWLVILTKFKLYRDNLTWPFPWFHNVTRIMTPSIGPPQSTWEWLKGIATLASWSEWWLLGQIVAHFHIKVIPSPSRTCWSHH